MSRRQRHPIKNNHATAATTATTAKQKNWLKDTLMGLVGNEKGRIIAALKKDKKECNALLKEFYENEFQNSLKKLNLSDASIASYVDESLTAAFNGEYLNPEWASSRVESIMNYRKTCDVV